MFKIITEQEIITKERNEVEVSLMGFIGYKVREVRQAADINMAQLSRRLASQGHNLSSTTIAKIEQGLCPLKIQDLHAIANYFELSMSEFYPEGVLS